MLGNAMQRLALIACTSLTCLISQARAAPLDSQGIATDLSFIETQVGKTLASLGSPASGYPVSGGDSGTWTTTTPSDGAQGWTTGFFPGQLWLLYQATGSPQWLAAAKQWTAPLASQANGRPVDPSDIGFIIGTSFGNGYRLTADPSYKSVLLTTGNSLASLYNPNVGAVRSWTFPPYQPPSHFAVTIDSMMQIGPLQWGAGNGGSSTWSGIAASHADTVTTNLVRLDGSTFQVADFNPTTGALMSRGTFAGYSDSSTWARGQAWALYGFVQAYQTSDNPAFLTTAEAVANYFVEHSPANGVPPWDFDAPGTQPVDTSAAAIAADGLVMLSTVAETGTLKAQYLQDAENILGSLSSNYLGPASGESVLFEGFPGNGGTNTALIYGDYYFTEALLRLQEVLDGKPGWILYSLTTVPETSTWAMMLVGFAGVGIAWRRRARAARAVA
jgi:unsaturated chondroitin disaccharide hydrolase